jgi:hypothetical protein
MVILGTLQLHSKAIENQTALSGRSLANDSLRRKADVHQQSTSRRSFEFCERSVSVIVGMFGNDLTSAPSFETPFELTDWYRAR